ncbi:hypothetical protein HG530_004680 [Fusarium avenaceum]|nr:hypothetical protein HG530_004680 [Fusarium avenaceum]
MASVWSLAAVRDNVDTHLTLRGLNRGVCLTRGNCVTLGVEQEVVDKGLHVLLHRSSGRRRDLVILNTDRALGHLVKALVNNTEGLSELLHSAKVSVVTVTVGSNRNIKLNLVISVVWLVLADIEGNTGTSEHDTGERKVQSLRSRNDTNTSQSLNPDTVISQHLLGLVDSVAELGGPLVNIVEKTNGDILVDTTGSNNSWKRRQLPLPFNRMTTTYHKLLTFLETPQERCQSTNIHSVGENGHQMVENTGDLAKQCSDELGSLRNFNVEKLLHGEREALLVGHHGDIIESIEVGKGLEICLVLDQLLGTSVQQTDVRIGSDDLFTIELENQTQHAVGSGMLGTEVDCVVSNLSVLNRVLARLSGTGSSGLGQAVGILSGEVFVNGHKSGANGLDRGGVPSQTGGRERAGGECCWPHVQAPGASAGESESSHCVGSRSERGRP